MQKKTANKIEKNEDVNFSQLFTDFFEKNPNKKNEILSIKPRCTHDEIMEEVRRNPMSKDDPDYNW
jgi:hypothetical protein